MIVSIRDRLKTATATWGQYVFLLVLSVFFAYLGQGVINGATTNFLVEVLGLSSKQVLWQAGIREIPGLGLMFIAALIAHWPLSRRAAASLLLMGVGYALHVFVHSYVALLAMALVASTGFHVWLPLESALGLALTEKEQAGRILGTLTSAAALASIVGMGVTALLATALPLRAFYILGGIAIVVGGLFIWRISPAVGKHEETQPRMTLKRRYWLYYVLIFFEGSRMQVFHAFGTLILVQNYGLKVREISLLLVLSGIVNFIVAPRLGRLLDGIGERVTLSVSYVALALCFVGYATVHNVWFLAAMLIGINLLSTLRIGLSTYVRRIAPSKELSSTLSAGVSINHITSVSMSLVAGSLLELVGYEWLCWGAAAVIMSSVPFALMIKFNALAVPEAQPGTA